MPIERLLAAALAVLLTACAGKPVSGPNPIMRPGIPSHSWPGQDGPPSEVPFDLTSIPDAVPRAEPRATRGNPPFYQIDGRRYFVLDSSAGHSERGIASWYGVKFHGRETSSGEPYDMFAMTAAHRTLPLPTYARVTNLENGRSVVVRINDRGPFAHNRVIDLSYSAAVRLDIIATGTGLVEVEALDPADQAPQPAVFASRPNIYIQVGAFANRENAELVAGRLRAARIYNVDLSTRAGEAPPLWRVRVGPLPNVAAVDDISTRVNAIGFPEARVVIE